MIAALPMYDQPWLRQANDGLWRALAAGLAAQGVAEVPRALSRGRDLEDIWNSPRLLLAQSCGYPLVTDLRESVQIVATPHYAAEGCEGAWHRAAIVVRAGFPARTLAGLRRHRAGINGRNSNTGMNLFRAAIAPLAEGDAFFASVTVTGSHARSLAALLSERIDVAAIDAVTLAHLRERYPRHAERIRIVAWTEPTPALPLITAVGTPPSTVSALRSALAGVRHEPEARPALDALRITAFETLELDRYRVVAELEQAAVALGYPVLR